MSERIADQLARLTAPSLFRKADAGVIAQLSAILLGAYNRADTDERKRIRQELKLKPPPQQLIDWALRQVGRWGLMQWLGKLPRPDPAAAALASATSVVKVLKAASRLGLMKANKGDDKIVDRWYRKVQKRRKTMAINYTFDPRGLPEDFDQGEWSKAVDAQLVGIGVPKAGNEVAYAGIKGALLLNEQFYPDAGSFRDGLRTAWDEVLIRKDAVPTARGKPVPNIEAYKKVAASLPTVTGKDDVFFQVLTSVARYVIGRSSEVPIDDDNFNTQVRIGVDQYVSGGAAFASLTLPEVGDDGQIVADNIRAVGTLAGCYYLEKLRVIDVVDRVTEVFFNGMLPIGFDSTGRALHDYYWSREDRLTPHERMSIFSRVLGVAGGDISKEVQPNKEYDPATNSFLASVAEYDRQRRATTIFAAGPGQRPLTFLGEYVRKTGNDVARNATLYGYGGTQFAARLIAEAVNKAFEILSMPAILRAYGVTSPYQVIERVAANDWHTQVNVVRYKTSADVVKNVYDILAKNANVWSKSNGDPLFSEPEPGAGAKIKGDLDADQNKLFTYAQQWLAVNGMQDTQVEKLSQPVESKAGASLPLLNGGSSGNGLDTIAKLQQMVSSGSTPSLDQLRQLLPAGNA